MPFSEDFLEENFRIWFNGPGHAIVRTGPCSASPWIEKTIPLDGRHYESAGKVLLKNGIELFAHLPIRTHTFDFLEYEDVFVKIDGLWYQFDEPELYVKLGISQEDALPYTWLPDIPLQYSNKGPYPMK